MTTELPPEPPRTHVTDLRGEPIRILVDEQERWESRKFAALDHLDTKNCRNCGGGVVVGRCCGRCGSADP